MTSRQSVQIRRPRPADFASEADATATMYLAARRAMLPDLRDPHTEAETRAWMRDTVFTRYSVRIAEVDGEIVGFAARDGAWLMQLYVKPGWTGRSIGTNLLRIVLADAAFATPVLRLYTFARNEGARRFYERHGFVAVAFGDGSGNQEGEPDIRYERSTRE
ncbi:MAG: GNAT family N-acetyltransferase [Casimicrobiaceae bacterium]